MSLSVGKSYFWAVRFEPAVGRYGIISLGWLVNLIYIRRNNLPGSHVGVIVIAILNIDCRFKIGGAKKISAKSLQDQESTEYSTATYV